MTSDEARVEIRREVVEHVRDGLKEVGPYIDAYLLSALTKPKNSVVPCPVGLHPVLAAFAREIVWDVLTAVRIDTVNE